MFCFPSFFIFKFGNVSFLLLVFLFLSLLVTIPKKNLGFGFWGKRMWSGKIEEGPLEDLWNLRPSEANCSFKNCYSSIYFWQKLRNPLPAFVLRLRMFSLLCFSLCWILYLLQVSVEGFLTHCLVHSLALTSWCSFALCVFINKSSAFTNNPLLFEVGRIF